jgi:hypothetical protein
MPAASPEPPAARFPDPAVERVAGVYAIRNRLTGAAYVGSSRDVGRRLAEHRFALEAGRHGADSLQADWRRLGAAAFEWRVLRALAPDDALLELHERAEMLRLDAFVSGYNRRADVFRGESAPLARLRALFEAQPRWARWLGLARRRALDAFGRELASRGVDPALGPAVAAWYAEDLDHLARYPGARGPRLWRRPLRPAARWR